MSDEPIDGEKFFEEHGYYYTKFVPPKPPKQVSRQTAIDHSHLECGCGPVVASIRARGFHHPDCKWVRDIHKLDKIIYACRHEAIRAGFLPCKYGCKS